MPNYFGAYIDFQTLNKKEAALLVGADNTVGDIYDIVDHLEEDSHKMVLINRFEQQVGYFDPDISRELALYSAKGMTLKAILSFVAYSEDEEGGHYWGNAAVICFDPAYQEEFSNFIYNVSNLIADNIRPVLDLDQNGVQKIIDSGGEWVPSDRISLPESKKGMAFIKRRRKMTEKMIEQGRKKNVGCYIVSWAFLLAIVALIVFAVKSIFF